MPHHLVSEDEQKTFCIYCKKEVPLSEWESDWHLEMHYKVLTCRNCGKDLRIKVNFEGSGHDSWNGKKFKSKVTRKESIEDTIRVLEGMQIVGRTHPKEK